MTIKPVDHSKLQLTTLKTRVHEQGKLKFIIRKYKSPARKLINPQLGVDKSIVKTGQIPNFRTYHFSSAALYKLECRWRSPIV